MFYSIFSHSLYRVDLVSTSHQSPVTFTHDLGFRLSIARGTSQCSIGQRSEWPLTETLGTWICFLLRWYTIPCLICSLTPTEKRKSRWELQTVFTMANSAFWKVTDAWECPYNQNVNWTWTLNPQSFPPDGATQMGWLKS